MRRRKDQTLAHHLRSIADILYRNGFRNFPMYLRAAAKEMYLMNYDLQMLKKRVLKLERNASTSGSNRG